MKYRNPKFYEKLGMYFSQKHSDAIIDASDWEVPSIQIRLYAHQSAYRLSNPFKDTTLQFFFYGVYPLYHLYGKLYFSVTKKVPKAKGADETKSIPFGLGAIVHFFFNYKNDWKVQEENYLDVVLD